MKPRTWRDRARPIIASILSDGSLSDADVKQALFDAYPFGERARYPYKIWLDEIRRQRGVKSGKLKDKSGRILVIPKDQQNLF